MYNILATGSTGNAVIYFDSILVDCGVPYSVIKPVISDVQLVLPSHRHHDHLNIKTLRKLAFERPTVRFAIGEYLSEEFKGFKNVDILSPGNIYDYGEFQISPVVLYHDVPNFGYRIFKNGKKIFHATDTAHLDMVEAKGYDLYAIEHNYDEDTVFEVIRRARESGEFVHQEGAINSHLSEQQAREFFFKNKGEHSKIIRLHESSLTKI